MRKRVFVLGAVVVGALVLFMCAGSLAVNPTDVSVSAEIAASIKLDMPDTTVDFGGGGLEAGETHTDSITATVKSNRDWVLNVKKDQDLTGTGTRPEVIASENLTFTSTSTDPKVTDKRTTATEFPSEDDWVVKGTRGNNITSTVAYSLSVPWELAPDTYTATHTYTVIQP